MNLVERDHAPGGFQLVNPEESGKRNQFDLVELASTIQTVNEILYQVTGSLITLCPFNQAHCVSPRGPTLSIKSAQGVYVIKIKLKIMHISKSSFNEILLYSLAKDVQDEASFFFKRLNGFDSSFPQRSPHSVDMAGGGDLPNINITIPY